MLNNKENLDLQEISEELIKDLPKETTDKLAKIVATKLGRFSNNNNENKYKIDMLIRISDRMTYNKEYTLLLLNGIRNLTELKYTQLKENFNYNDLMELVTHTSIIIGDNKLTK